MGEYYCNKCKRFHCDWWSNICPVIRQEKYNRLLKRKDKIKHRIMSLEIRLYDNQIKLEKVENEIEKYEE